MTSDSILSTLFVFLVAAVLAVPGAQKLGLGRVLGYLVAGILAGPWGLALIREPAELQLLTELGTGILLFLLGMELKPALIRGMWQRILLQGIPFWLLTAGAFLLIGLVNEQIWYKAVAIAVALAMSSATLVREFIATKNLGGTSRGDLASSIVTSQVLLFFPVLVLLPLIGFGNPLQEFTGISGVLIDLGLSALVVGVGHIVLKQVFRYITSTQSPELFIAAVLLMLVGTVLLFENLGSSALLGAYLAGYLMGLSEFNRELDSSIGPFRGLLLGFFFLTFGVSIDLGLLLQYPHIVLAVLVVMLAVKFSLALLITSLRDGWHRQHVLTALLVAPAGELSFVLLAVAMAFQALGRELGSGLMVVVALSMLLTPLMQAMYRRRTSIESVGDNEASGTDFLSGTDDTLPRDSKTSVKSPGRMARLVTNPFAETSDSDLSVVMGNAREVPVLVAGFGRVGQTVSRILASAGMKPTIIDHDPARLFDARRLGYSTLCGDALRLDLLEAAGIETARVLVVALDDHRHSVALVNLMQQHYPATALVVRGIDRYHQIELACAGVDKCHRENFESAVLLGEDTLTALGIDWEEAERISEAFRDHETRLIEAEISAGQQRLEQGEDVFSPALSLGYRQVDSGLAELLQKDLEAHRKEQTLKTTKGR